MRDENKSTFDMPMQTRLLPVGSVDAEARTATLTWTTGQRVRRYDWLRDTEYFEELSTDPKHIRMERLESGAPLLDSHARFSVGNVIGVVESASVSDGAGVATVRFSERAEVEPIFNDVRAGIIRNVSVGYIVHKVEVREDKESGLPVRLAVDWEPMELSLVPVGADKGAGVRNNDEQQTYPCELIHQTTAVAAERKEQSTMGAETQNTAASEAVETKTRDAEADRRAIETERRRVREITQRCEKFSIDTKVRDELIDNGASLEKAGERILDELAQRQESEQGTISSTYGSQARVVDDPREHMRAHMAEAIAHRLSPRVELSEGAREFRYMPLLRMAEEVLRVEGVSVRGLSRMDIATRALMSTSDFPNILADTMNKRLRQQYMENVPSYRRWARRAANAPDFKTIRVAQLGAAPNLEAVPEGAEFKRGSLEDGSETYSITTYGKIVSVSRQALINDDLNAFDRFPGAFAGSASRLENSVVYGILSANANMSDGNPLFDNANHGNEPTAAAIAEAGLKAARKAMRDQTGLAGEKLNLVPVYIIVGTANEQDAYKFTSSQFVPAKTADINEFRAGGRTALEPVVDAEVAGTNWYLAADPAQIDTIEYCYLDGNEGVYLESAIGFTVDGIDMKARNDFAAKAIDWRGLVHNAGV